MNGPKNTQQIGPVMRDLYPTMTGAQLREAAANLRRYFKVAPEVQKEQAVSRSGFDMTPDPATIEERWNANSKS